MPGTSCLPQRKNSVQQARKQTKTFCRILRSGSNFAVTLLRSVSATLVTPTILKDKEKSCNPDRIIQNWLTVPVLSNQHVHPAPENANMCIWVDVKGLFEAPGNHSFQPFSVSRGWSESLREGKKDHQRLSLSPQLRRLYLSWNTLQIQIHFACFVCQRWKHSLIRSRLEMADLRTRLRVLNPASLLQLMGLVGFVFLRWCN